MQSYLILSYKFTAKELSKILIVCNIQTNAHITTSYGTIEDFSITTSIVLKNIRVH